MDQTDDLKTTSEIPTPNDEGPKSSQSEEMESKPSLWQRAQRRHLGYHAETLEKYIDRIQWRNTWFERKWQLGGMALCLIAIVLGIWILPSTGDQKTVVETNTEEPGFDTITINQYDATANAPRMLSVDPHASPMPTSHIQTAESITSFDQQGDFLAIPAPGSQDGNPQNEFAPMNYERPSTLGPQGAWLTGVIELIDE